MHIQFVGAPGSGKSTLVDALIKLNPDIYVRGEKKFTTFKQLLKEPLFFIKTLSQCLFILPTCAYSAQASSVGQRDKLTAIFGLITNLANYSIAERKIQDPKKIILWDELVLQRALSIFGYSKSIIYPSGVGRFVQWAHKVTNSVPVFVECEFSILFDRLSSRGVPHRMNRLLDVSIPDILNTQLTLLSHLKFISQDFVAISTEIELHDCAKSLNESLIHILNSSLVIDGVSK